MKLFQDLYHTSMSLINHSVYYWNSHFADLPLNYVMAFFDNSKLPLHMLAISIHWNICTTNNYIIYNIPYTPEIFWRLKNPGATKGPQAQGAQGFCMLGKGFSELPPLLNEIWYSCTAPKGRPWKLLGYCASSKVRSTAKCIFHLGGLYSFLLRYTPEI